MGQPQYIDRGGELVYAPPFLAEKVDFYGFILDADINKLQEMCDRYLNGPLGANKRFVPAGGFVLLACCNLPSLRSTAAPYSGYGSYAEKEIAFWVLTIDTVAERLFWYLPYIAVDNQFAMAMGRELYGFPKNIGTIAIPSSADNPDTFSIDLLCMRKYSPTSQGEIVRLIQVDKSTNPQTKEDSIWQDMESFTKEVVHLLDDAFKFLINIELVIHTLDDMLHLRIPMVFLKQFRDVTVPTEATVQCIVETEPFAKAFHSAKIYGSDYDVSVEVVDSHPIRSELGLAASGPLRSKLSFWANFDFEIDTGTICK